MAGKEFDKGFAVVVGKRPVNLKYAGQPWSEVEAAATRGDDGLRLTNEGKLREGKASYLVYDLPADHFALRKIHSATFGQIAGLMLQNW
jgi:hypothetical protein